jgi:hypothetical protein
VPYLAFTPAFVVMISPLFLTGEAASPMGMLGESAASRVRGQLAKTTLVLAEEGQISAVPGVALCLLNQQRTALCGPSQTFGQISGQTSSAYGAHVQPVLFQPSCRSSW